MLASSRTYRLMAALMAVLLLVSGGLPLVQHACAMEIGDRPTEDPPCPRTEHEQASAHHGMHGLMPAPSQAEQPCPHEMHQASPGDCCAVEAPPAVTTNGARLLKRSLQPVSALIAAVPAEALSQPHGPRSHALFFDTGPPASSSVSRHLLHAVLLN